MSLSDYTPDQIVPALIKFLKTQSPKKFVDDLPALHQSIKSTDGRDVIAAKIKIWCKDIPQIEKNLENTIDDCGIGGTDDDAPEEIVREFMETMKENMIRLYPSGPPVPVVETDDSGTESVENPT